MACSQCDHTMQAIADFVFWCPRCGTLKIREQVEPTLLVQRVIEFAGLLTDEHEDLTDAFERLGILESITLEA